MAVTWDSEDEGFHTAECALDTGQVVHLLAGSAGRRGWVWQARLATGGKRSHHGMADTLAVAKAMAELALLAGPPTHKLAA